MAEGDGGAAPMQVEKGEDDARDPTGEFISRGQNFSANLTRSNFSKILTTTLAKFDLVKSYRTGPDRYRSTPIPVPVNQLGPPVPLVRATLVRGSGRWRGRG